MTQPLSDNNIPLQMRTTAANLALALVDAMTAYGPHSRAASSVWGSLCALTADMQICLKAAELNNEWDE